MKREIRQDLYDYLKMVTTDNAVVRNKITAMKKDLVEVKVDLSSLKGQGCEVRYLFAHKFDEH